MNAAVEADSPDAAVKGPAAVELSTSIDQPAKAESQQCKVVHAYTAWQALLELHKFVASN